MVNEEQINLLRKSGTDNNNCAAWNQWHQENPDVRIDLSFADLTSTSLTSADLRNACLLLANLTGADLTGADLLGVGLFQANLTGADLTGVRILQANFIDADLRNARLLHALVGAANLTGANLTGADLRNACLSGANLTGANLTDVYLMDADLSQCVFIRTILTRANMSGSSIYGVSVWDVQADGSNQNNLIISDYPYHHSNITVDDLEVAQFIYLLLNNQKLRKVIGTMVRKAVLILGRFTEERLEVLNAIRDVLRRHDYLPILFDFEKAPERDYTETVVALAHLCRFVIADLTDPRSIQQELTAFVPTLEIPVQPIIQQAQKPWTMFSDFRRKYHWVLEPYEYIDLPSLIAALPDEVLAPAEMEAKEIQRHPW